MKKPGMVSILSIVANLLLSIGLILTYLNDIYLRNYVDQTVSANYASVVLAFGIGGGSTLGYLLLRRRQSGLSIGGRLQRAKPAKQVSPMFRPNGASLQNRNIPQGAPPAPASKHTAYAVPPLSKPGQGVQRSSPSPSWAAAPRPWNPSSPQGQQQEQAIPASKSLNQSDSQRSLSMTSESSTERPGTLPYSQATKREPSDHQRIQPTSQAPPTFSSARQDPREDSILPQPVEEIEKNEQTSFWKPDSPNEAMRSDKATSPFPRVIAENPARPSSPFSGQIANKTPQAIPTFQPSRLQATDTNPQPKLWVNPVPRQEYSTPQKWQPPSVSPVPNPRPQTSQGPPIRPGQASQSRPQFPGPQGTPRPLTYSGPPRPSPSGEVPGMFRPDLRHPLGTGIQQRPQMIFPKQMPQSTSQIEGRREPSSSQTEARENQPASQTQREIQPVVPASSSPGAGESSIGEMDWDTALDAILKTLRKDKVGEKS